MNNWNFIDEDGTFTLSNPQLVKDLYFPLVNQAGMMSSVTPGLHGDIKTGQNSFLTLPVSVEDLHNSRAGRNFWVYTDSYGPWSVAGASSRQYSEMFNPSEADHLSVAAGLLWHKLTCINLSAGLKAETINFIPANTDQVELIQVTVTNIGERTVEITPTAAVPIYGRSADNLRDHRHVTSLLHRIRTERYGVLVKPSMSFDERGHKLNTTSYTVVGVEEGNDPPIGFYPTVDGFIGNGGTLDWPEAVVKNSSDYLPAGSTIAGYEAIGGLRFNTTALGPGESRSYLLVLGVLNDGNDLSQLIERYGTKAQFQHWLSENKSFWQGKISGLIFTTADHRFNGWLKWVSVQPILRRLFGNSFLPYHDYGRGGRGWRDLWQDTLTQLMMEPAGVDELLWNYYAGVRIDGSNATIIGAKPGEFKADRNDIPRVWMDHGAWPWLTTKLYIDQSGDLEFLLREQAYFKDRHIDRCQSHDKGWHDGSGTQLLDQNENIYLGSILEHILVQHLTAFFNVGEHNNIRLEGGDWNDGMDMAPRRGESVAFTALYASNLRQISQMLMRLSDSDVPTVDIAAELLLLLDTISDPVNYGSSSEKRDRLAEFFSRCRNTITGERVTIEARVLAEDLEEKSSWLFTHLQNNEWIQDRAGIGWFNGYYDEDGNRVEGVEHDHVRMTLTGQVFTMMGGIADDKQISAMVQAANNYLWEESMGGYRLNTDFEEVLPNLGRFSGFAFGHKENGAMFSHMSIMWANALLKRGLVKEGLKVIETVYRHCQNFPISHIYPGIPEYINPEGRGMYPYLTGSASWLLLTMLTEIYGVKGYYGDLVLEPNLSRDVFDEQGEASVSTQFAGRQLQITYSNPERLEFNGYSIHAIKIDGQAITIDKNKKSVTLSREVIEDLSSDQVHEIEVELRSH